MSELKRPRSIAVATDTGSNESPPGSVFWAVSHVEVVLTFRRFSRVSVGAGPTAARASASRW